MPSFLDRLLGRPEPVAGRLMPLGTRPVGDLKAVYGGAALTAYQNDVPLSFLNNDPVDRAKA